MLVNNPVHELEADERHRKDDAAVFVNVRSSHAEHLVQVLHVTLRIWWRWSRRRGQRLRGRWRRHRRKLWRVSKGWRTHVMRVHWGWGLLVISATAAHTILSTCRAISANGVFARTTLAMHFRVMHLKMNRLEGK